MFVHQHSLESLPTDFLGALQPVSCFHLAWQSGSDLHAFEHVAFARHSLNFARSLAEHGCLQFVGVGTNYEYDCSLGYLSEQSPLLPQTMHAAAKLALYTGLKEMERRGAMRTVWVRPFFLYGPSEEPRRLVAAVIRALESRTPFETTSGEQIRDFLHAEDVAAGICAAAQANLPVANIGSGNPISVRDLVFKVAALMKGEEFLRFGALPRRLGEPPFICANNALLRQTGWAPFFDLESGLRDTIRWWREHGK